MTRWTFHAKLGGANVNDGGYAYAKESSFIPSTMSQPPQGVRSIDRCVVSCGPDIYKVCSSRTLAGERYRPAQRRRFLYPAPFALKPPSHSILTLFPTPEIGAASTKMAITYALPSIPTRPDKSLWRSNSLKENSAPRRLTPYPDPKKAFPLSDDYKDERDEVDEVRFADPEDTALQKAVAEALAVNKSSPDDAKPIEINFCRISRRLRRSPSNPPVPLIDRSKRERRSSLPSLVSSSFDNFTDPKADRPRRNGWLPGEAFVQCYLKDLKR